MGCNVTPRKPREKRKYPRIEAKVKVAFRSIEDLVQEFTRNISAGGIFLKTDQLLDPNAEIDLLMTFPNRLGEYRVKGRVTRLMSMSHPSNDGRQLYGVGIRFVAPDHQMIKTIEQVIGLERTPKEKA